jgi:glutamate-1-semialdehyde 2,1-aminomutase
MKSLQTEKYRQSAIRLIQSRGYLAGGVSSAMRANSKPQPLFFGSGSGAMLVDVDGNRYIDYSLAWGPLILGHCDERINSAVEQQMKVLQQVGAQHDLEWQVAEQICRIVPCADRVVFSNTGTEAVQIAIRIARASTGRNRILRFAGHYHGWADNALVGYRPRIVDGTLALPAGVDRNVLDQLIVLPWNDLGAVERVLRTEANDIAAILTEPILCNSGCLMPKPGYLEGLRNLSDRYGAVLIFDEVITGFRVAPGGAQALLGVTPDLATFAKAIAGGFPMSAVAGRQRLMELVETGLVPHAGTYNGNPVCLAAAHVVMDVLEHDNGAALDRVRVCGERLMTGLEKLAERADVPILLNGVGSIFHLFFTEQTEMKSHADTLKADAVKRDLFIEAMLEAGVYLLPDGRWYVSTAHSHDDIDATLSMAAQAFEKLTALASRKVGS